jgi:MoaA/NifB/PqqE/SkfB family radical SAM enzyme
MINYPKNITDIHIELTDKCQASCPMCARNYNGGAERPFVGSNDITIENFKAWFSPEFLKNIKTFYACGNYGDPILAKDCLEIFEYVRQVNKQVMLCIHTNGSARTTEWWKRLAGAMAGGPHNVVFAIDGYEKSHVLYRRDTDWTKIIENAKTFMTAGGTANIDCLVFRHNQDEILDFKQDMLAIGFKNVMFKYTARFYDMKEFPVEDKHGKVEYALKPATNESAPIQFLPLSKMSKDISIWENIVESTAISPRCKSSNEIFVDCRGIVSPCCWVGCDIREEQIPVKFPMHDLKNKVVKNTQMHFKKFSELNLNTTSINDILSSDAWSFVDSVNETKPWTCAKNCKK